MTEYLTVFDMVRTTCLKMVTKTISGNYMLIHNTKTSTKQHKKAPAQVEGQKYLIAQQEQRQD
eukprot:2380730-Amphidinium_carterae.1